MVLREVILACTLLILCSADQTLTAVNSMLDPNRICWWRTKWAAAPILLSINNRSKVSSVTFLISPTTSITAGVLEVTFPAEFTLPSTVPTGATVSGQIYTLSGQTYTGGQDYPVSISSITNPSKVGAYGPFALRTRYNTGGQQVDVNLNFGYVYIYGDAGNIGALSVTLAGTTINNVINKSGNTLSFKFTIGVSLWRYDTFVINMDPRWTIASGATCSSADYSGKWNNFNGTNTANPHALQCFITSKSTTSPSQTAFIYGLAVDGIDLTASADNASVDLRVTSVTTPDAVYSATLFSWTVSTFRFQTATNLETASFTGGPAVTYDTIASATWTPTWGMAATDMISGSAYFMDLVFSITNAIPAGGSIDISVTEDVTTGDSNWQSTLNCYVATYMGRDVVCTINTNSIQLSALPALTAGSSIKIRNVVKISRNPSETAKVSYIKTFQSTITTSAQIDMGTNLASFIIPATSSATIITAANLGITFVDISSTGSATESKKAGGMATATGTSNQGIQFWVILANSGDFTATATLTINCPFTSTVDDFGIGISSVSTTYLASATQGAINISSGTTAVANSVNLSPSGSSATHGSLAISGSVGATVNGNMHFLISPSGTSIITLPRVANNLATAYECRAAVTGSSITSQRNAVRFTISPQTLNTKDLAVPCQGNMNGLPVMVTYLPPFALPIQASSTGQTYYVEFAFASTAGMGSGLTITAASAITSADLLSYAVDYPHDKSVTTSTSAKMYVVGTTNYVAVTGLPSLTSAGTPITVYFPVGGLSTSSYSVAIKTYYVTSPDSRYQFVSHSSTTTQSFTPSGTYTSGFDSSATNTPVILTNSDQTVNGEASSGLTLDITFVADNSAGSNYYFFFVLPAGYTWSSSKAVRNLLGTATNYSSAWYFSSTATNFAYPGVLVYTGVGTSNTVTTIGATGSANGSLSLIGFKLPLGVPSSNPSISLTAGPSTSNSNCYANTSFTFKPQPGSITNLSVSPATTKARGSDGINVKHTVSFTLAHGIPVGGSIVMSFAADWSPTTCTTCVATGLTPAVSTTPVTCALATSTVTVSGFADFSTTASTAITIEVNNLLPPISATTTGINFVSTLSSQASGGLTIDTTTTFTGTVVTVTTAATPSATTWTTMKTYPMTAGATSVDLYLKFSLPHSLPRCGIITLSSPLAFKLTGTTAKNSCFLSPVQYSDCSMNGSSLQITLAADYTGGSVLELFLDAAVDNPPSAATTSTGFSIVSTWGNIPVDQDTGAVQTSQLFTASASLVSTITGSAANSLSFSPKTAGEIATYTFDFKDSANFASGDQFWIVFPPQYDYFLGDVWQWFTNEPNTYYIDCSSTQLGTTWCTIDHNVVVVTGSNAITGSTEIVISIQNVVNPPAAQTGAFQIFHVNSKGEYQTINQSYGTVTPTASVSNLDVRSLDQSDRHIFKSSNLVWRLYISDTMNTDSQLKVLFPREYDLSKFDKKDSYQCSSTWYDNSPAATVKTQQTWNAAASCAASGNWVTLPSPTTASTFTANHIVTWTIQAVGNPQWGQTRSALTTSQDFDVTDSVLWPLDPMWASKFTFFVYRSLVANLAYTSRSYPNMNAAYAGFYQSNRQLLVNSYVPQSKTNRIVVYAGTQTTDLYISTVSASSPMSAKQIVLTPTTNSRTSDSGKLRYTSVVDNFTIVQSRVQIQFRVAAAIDMVKGLYYIDWSNNETKQTGASDVQYDIPASTLVEVIAKKAGQYAFTVAAIPNLFVGFTSVPIKVSVTNAPHTDVTLNLSVAGTPANISLNPTSLTFGPDINALYFQIQIASNYDTSLSNSQTVQFTLTGTDAYAFSSTSTAKFTITAQTNVSPGTIQNWGLSTPTKTIVTVTPVVDQVGVLYYQLAAAGTAVPSFSALKSSVTSLLNQNATSYPGSSEGSRTETDPKTGESWIIFQQRLYRTHLNTQWSGAISMLTTTLTPPLKFDWLWADTKYQISGYLDNLSSSSTAPTASIATFQTAATADCQPFSVKFQGSVTQSYSSKILQEAANVNGANPGRYILPTYATSNTRALQGTTTAIAYTTFSYTLLPNRFSESPSPADQAKITGTALSAFTAALVADGISNSLNSVANGPVPQRTIPQWTILPSSGGSTTNSVTVVLRSSVAGQTCCVALTASDASLTAEQVMLGLDPSNAAASGNCISTDLTLTSNSVQISGLQMGTTYYTYCTATDAYPLWPMQMVYSSSNPMSTVPIATLSTNSTTTTDARRIGGSLLLAGLLLQ